MKSSGLRSGNETRSSHLNNRMRSQRWVCRACWISGTPGEHLRSSLFANDWIIRSWIDNLHSRRRNHLKKRWISRHRRLSLKSQRVSRHSREQEIELMAKRRTSKQIFTEIPPRTLPNCNNEAFLIIGKVFEQSVQADWFLFRSMFINEEFEILHRWKLGHVRFIRIQPKKRGDDKEDEDGFAAFAGTGQMLKPIKTKV